MIREIKRVTYGKTTIPESWVFVGGDQEVRIPIILSVFMVRTEEKLILIDAGCETMPGFELHDYRTPLEALCMLGVEPDAITDVVLTHAHHDHIECVKYFHNAVVYIHEKEMQAGKGYLQESRYVQTFTNRIEIDEGVTVVWIGGHSEGSCVVECRVRGEVIVLCGDECYTSYNLINQVPTAISFNLENSRKFINLYAKPPFCCLLCHDLQKNDA